MQFINTHRRVFVLLVGFVVLCGVWFQHRFDDAYANADLIMVIVAAVVSASLFIYVVGTPPAQMHPPSIRRAMVTAGVGMLFAVVIRQWLQLSYNGGSVMVEPVDVLSRVLMRYGVIQLVVWMTGWCYVIAALIPHIDIRPWYTRHRYEVWGLCGIVLCAAFVRWYALGAIPNIINGDEGLIGMWSVQLLTQGGTLGHVFVNMDGVGTNYLLVMKAVIAVFGRTEFAVRLIPAIFGTLAIIPQYLFARSLFGVRVGMIAAGLLAAAHVHIHFSRTVAVSYTYATFFLPMLLWGIWMLIQHRSLIYGAIAACALSLHINTYVDAWAWSVLVVLILVVWYVFEYRAMASHTTNIALTLGLMCCGLLPMIIWGVFSPGDFFARLSSDGSIVSGWLAREAEARSVPQGMIVVELYRYAFATFLSTPFEDFYHANVPILDSISAVLFIIGLVYAHIRLYERGMVMLLGWFWGGMTALAVFTIPISTYPYRLLVIVPVVIVLVALAIERIAGFIRLPRIRNTMVVVVVVCIALINIEIYRSQLATVCRYGGDRKTEQAGVLARFLARTVKPGDRVIVLGNAPDGFYVGPWRSLQFLNPDVQLMNSEDTSADSTTVPANAAIWYVAIPERVGELPMDADALAPIPLQQCSETLLYAINVSQP